MSKPDSPEDKLALMSEIVGEFLRFSLKLDAEEATKRVMKLVNEYYTNKFLEIVGEDEPEKKDGRLYSGYSDKDWDVIKVPNKSAIQRNKFRAKLRLAIKQLSKE